MAGVEALWRRQSQREPCCRQMSPCHDRGRKFNHAFLFAYHRQSGYMAITMKAQMAYTDWQFVAVAARV